MNKKCYRVIFSKTLQRLVVVSEISKSETKSSANSPEGRGGIFANLWQKLTACSLKPLTFSLFCALGFVSFSEQALADTLIIKADPTAPKNQQPIILQTANGIPQVNIQTPNDKGLSHNKYHDFNVDTQGAILNNSRTNTKTQQAGLVQGNPYLARGEAKVILNEVTSNNPSQLKGYVEVAGKKAEVVIANPNGIHCEGCGVINSSRATFTTGKPQLKAGDLDAFVVEKGKISTAGKGLDASQADYTDIIAKETALNAGVWTKQKLNVVTGTNTVKRGKTDENLQILHTHSPLAETNTATEPRFAVDVGELGGMYAGKIHLIGTEQGLGVRNAGHIGAAAENVQIDSQGKIINRGTINAVQGLTFNAKDGIENHGRLETKQQDIQLNAEQHIQQDGSAIARAGSVNAKAKQKLTQQGETVAKGDIRYTAKTIEAGKTSILAAGVTIQDTPQGEVRTLENQHAQGKQIQLTANQSVTAQGKNIASGEITAHGTDINLNHSQTSAHRIEANATAGDIQANHATLNAQNELKLTTPKTLSTQHSQLRAERIHTKQQRLDTAHAVWEQTGTGELRLESEEIRNQGGSFSTQGDLVVKAGTVDNREGKLISAQHLNIQANQVNSAQGVLGAGEQLTLNASEVNNQQGLIQSKNLSLKASTLNNRETLSEKADKGIIALDTLQLESQTIDNQAGRIVSQNAQTIKTATLNNQKGGVQSFGDLSLSANSVQNDGGAITAQQSSTINTGNLHQASGQISAKNLHLTATQQLNSTQGSVISAEQLAIQTKGELNNQNSQIVGKQSASISTQAALNNQEGVIGSQVGTLTLNTSLHSLNNTKGVIAAGNGLTLQSGALDNQQGLISGKNVQLNTHHQALNNQNTLDSHHRKGIVAQENLALETGALHNQQGEIVAYKNANMTATTVDNHQGKIRVSEQLALQTQQLSQTQGLISAGTLNLTAPQVHSTQQSEISANHINLTADTLVNTDSKLIAKDTLKVTANQGIENQNGTLASLQGNAQLELQQSTLNNTHGTLFANQSLNIQSGELNNHNGLIKGNQIVIDTHQQGFINRDTQADNKGVIAQTLSLNAGVVDNQHGRVIAVQNGTFNAEQLQNQQGEVLVGSTGSLQAAQIDNTEGTIAATTGSFVLATTSVLNNHKGTVSAVKDLQLDTQGINNREGQIHSQSQLNLDTHTQQLDNQAGKIFANHTATLNTGEINNQQGLIRGNQQLHINAHHQQIDNRNTQGEQQGIISAANAVLEGISTLLNQNGLAYAHNDLNVNVDNAVSNQQGTLKSAGNLALSSHSLDNQAGTVSAKTTTLNILQIDNRATGNTGSLIAGTESLTLNSQQIHNQGTKAKDSTPKQGIQSRQLVINTDTLSNQQGGIYSTDTAALNVTQRLDNQQGELLSANRIEVGHQGDLMLNNQEGLIQGTNAISLNAKGIENEGSIKTQGDLTVRLKDSFTLNKAFEVGNNLDFKTEGNFVNNVEQIVKNKATISANQVVNNANAEISSTDTTINANALTNRGLIDGDNTRINSQSVTNIGTGRIYGNHLAFKSARIDNLAETVNGETKAGTIAARERLDFGVGTLTNRDHALILSLGEMYIGGDLDAQGNAIGKAKFVDNGSATIEVLGSGKIKTERLLNHDLYLKLGIEEKSEDIHEVAQKNDSQRYRVGVDGIIDWSKRKSDAWFDFYDESKPTIYQKEWYGWKYKRTTRTPYIAHQDPAKISIGRDLVLEGEDLHNSNQLHIGGKLYLGDKEYVSNPSNTDLSHNGTTLWNDDLKGKIEIDEDGHAYFLQHYRSKVNRRHGHEEKYLAEHAPDTQYLTKDFNLVLNTIGTKLTDSGASIANQTKAKNVELDSISITGPSNGTGAIQAVDLFSPKMKEGDDKTHIVVTPTFNDKDKDQVVSSGQVIGTLDTTVQGFKLKDFGELKLPSVKTHLTEVALPGASLYRINPDGPNGYLVETDPKFARRQEWLSSDYLFNQLRHNHDNVQKRLGDGYYEQRLINEQVNQLTGRRFIEGYRSDIEQYKALMDSGVKYAKQFNLRVGVGLTAKQMSELTTDMVWFVNKEVTLASGQKVTALVPQVYLVARDSDINSRGAVISANVIEGSVGNLKNNGVVAGRYLTQVYANQLENRGTILGDNVDLSATQNLINLGGKVVAAKSASLHAGKNLEIASTLSHSEGKDFAQTVVDQLGGVEVTGKGGQLSLTSDGNVTVKAASLRSGGDIYANAGNALNITTLGTKYKANYNGSADNYYRINQESEEGSRVNAEGNITLIGKDNAYLRQVAVHSENGKVSIGSMEDVTIEAGRSGEQLATGMKSTSRGLLSKTTHSEKHDHNTTEAVASEIDGKEVSIFSLNGTTTVKGSNVVAEQDLLLQGKVAVNVLSDKDTHFEENESYTRKSGVSRAGKFGVSIGSQSDKTEADETKERAARSQVGSLSGNTRIVTDGHYQQTGSVVTGKGGVDIYAASANVTGARSDYESHYRHTHQQKGVTVAVSTPITNAIQAVESAAKSAKALGSSQNSRINALGAVNAGFEAWRTGEQLGELGETLAKNPTQAMTQASVSVTYGQQKSEETQRTQGNTVEKSQINSDGKVKMHISGKGDDSKLAITAADVAGKGGTELFGEGGVLIGALDENHLERSQNKSSGFNAGVAMTMGQNGFSYGLTAGGNKGKGYGNGDSQSWVGSQVGSRDSKTIIKTNRTVDIEGSQVYGKKVSVTAENLNVKSLQDTAHYEGKQENISGQVTVGMGASASGSYSKSKVKNDYASVNQQAGIFTGDEGYDIHVSNHTHLEGGLVTSTEKAEAEGKNHFTTGTITQKDIENHANSKGSSVGVSGGVAMNFDTPLGKSGTAQSSKTVIDENGNKQRAMGAESLETSMSVGMGSTSESASSVTKSGINTKNIEIRNTEAQQQLTGKSVEEMKAELKTDITTDTAEARSGKLENRFDKDKMQKELDYQVKVTQEFQTITLPVIDKQMNKQAEEARKAAKEAAQKGDSQTANKLNEEAKKWETGGDYRQAIDAVSRAVGLALGGTPTEGVVAAAASPYINEQIKHATEGNPTANAVAHAVWGAVESKFQGGSAAAGATAAAVGELGAAYIAESLYGTNDPNKLTEAQKQTVTELSKTAAGLASGLTVAASGGNSLETAKAAQTGQGIAESAVENNYLSVALASERKRIEEKLKDPNTTPEEAEKLNARKSEIDEHDRQTDIELERVCRTDPLSKACQNNMQEIKRFEADYFGSSTKQPYYGMDIYTRNNVLYPEEANKVAGYSNEYDYSRNAKAKNIKDIAKQYGKYGLTENVLNAIDGSSQLLGDVAAAYAGSKLKYQTNHYPSSGVQHTRKNVGDSDYPEGISFNVNLKNHLKNVDGFTQKGGIKGGHNRDNFVEELLNKRGGKILEETKTGIEGITNITYSYPKFDRQGNQIGYKTAPSPKTVYDPRKFSDDFMLELSQKAAAKSYLKEMNGNINNGGYTEKINGINFRVYLNKETGEIRNVHPN